MAATESATPKIRPAGQETVTIEAALPHADIVKLAALYSEAEETAHLANLLGRAPYAAGILTLAALLAAATAFASMPALQIAVWLALMALAPGAIVRSYARTIRAPFERAPLTAFTYDLSAILAYAGFAWGAGAFLVLPLSAGLPAAVAFAALPPALVAASLRTRNAALLFLGPVTALSAAAMVLRPLANGVLAAALTLFAAAAVAGAVLWLDRPHGRKSFGLAELPFN